MLTQLKYFKIYEYEITFQLSNSILKSNLITILKTLLTYISKVNGVVTDVKLSLKTSKTINKYKLKKLNKNIFNSRNPKYNHHYIYTLHVKMNPFLLKEFLYNLKLRKITSNIICIKHQKNI